jgi:hypothetical protein
VPPETTWRPCLRNLLTIAALVLALAGCESTIVLRNPETGEMTQCTTAGNGSLLAAREVELCAATYERAGWERMTGR